MRRAGGDVDLSRTSGMGQAKRSVYIQTVSEHISPGHGMGFMQHADVSSV